MGSGYKPEPAEDMLAPKLLFGSVNRREKEFLFKIVFPNRSLGTSRNCWCFKKLTCYENLDFIECFQKAKVLREIEFFTGKHYKYQ